MQVLPHTNSTTFDCVQFTSASLCYRIYLKSLEQICPECVRCCCALLTRVNMRREQLEYMIARSVTLYVPIASAVAYGKSSPFLSYFEWKSSLIAANEIPRLQMKNRKPKNKNEMWIFVSISNSAPLMWTKWQVDSNFLWWLGILYFCGAWPDLRVWARAWQRHKIKIASTFYDWVVICIRIEIKGKVMPEQGENTNVDEYIHKWYRWPLFCISAMALYGSQIVMMHGCV